MFPHFFNRPEKLTKNTSCASRTESRSSTTFCYPPHLPHTHTRRTRRNYGCTMIWVLELQSTHAQILLRRCLRPQLMLLTTGEHKSYRSRPRTRQCASGHSNAVTGKVTAHVQTCPSCGACGAGHDFCWECAPCPQWSGHGLRLLRRHFQRSVLPSYMAVAVNSRVLFASPFACWLMSRECADAKQVRTILLDLLVEGRLALLSCLCSHASCVFSVSQRP